MSDIFSGVFFLSFLTIAGVDRQSGTFAAENGGVGFWLSGQVLVMNLGLGKKWYGTEAQMATQAFDSFKKLCISLHRLCKLAPWLWPWFVPLSCFISVLCINFCV